MRDVIADMGPLFIASRLKRLGERMQAGTAIVIAEAGLPLQPVHMPVLAALRSGPLSVGQLAEAVGVSQPGATRTIGQMQKLGIIAEVRDADQRRKLIALTEAGHAAAELAAKTVWPRVGQAASELIAGLEGSFLNQLSAIESALADASIAVRAARRAPAPLRLHEYSEDLAREFHDINAEWITGMFVLEATDRDVLENPHAKIIATGGTILFVEAPGLGIVGTCALQKTGPTSFELTKMGVRESARGLKAGEFLLAAVIERAQELGANPLYLLTNHRCAAAIHLYEKLGFAHDAGIMADYGARYERCDVAMRFARPLNA